MKRIFWTVLLVLTFGCFAFSAPPDNAIENFLRTTYRGQTLTFRCFYAGGRLHYDTDGKILEGGALGPWTLYGLFIPTEIHFRKGKIEFLGDRVFVRYVVGETRRRTKQLDRSNKRVHVNIEIKDAHPTQESVTAILGRVFLTPSENLVDFVPSYWKKFLSPAEESTAEKGLPEGVSRVGRGVSAPQVVSRKELEFTPEARAAKIDGLVILSVIIRRTGDLEIMDIILPFGYGLDEAAMEGLRQWSFQPSEKEGVPVDVKINIEANFSLKKKQR